MVSLRLQWQLAMSSLCLAFFSPFIHSLLWIEHRILPHNCGQPGQQVPFVSSGWYRALRICRTHDLSNVVSSSASWSLSNSSIFLDSWTLFSEIPLSCRTLWVSLSSIAKNKIIPKAEMYPTTTEVEESLVRHIDVIRQNGVDLGSPNAFSKWPELRPRG